MDVEDGLAFILAQAFRSAMIPDLVIEIGIQIPFGSISITFDRYVHRFLYTSAMHMNSRAAVTDEHAVHCRLYTLRREFTRQHSFAPVLSPFLTVSFHRRILGMKT